MNNEQFDLRQRLLNMRQSTALYQEETAELLDLPYKTYQAIEGGRRKAIRLDTLEKIAEGYGIELWELFHPRMPTLPAASTHRALKIMRHRQIPHR